MFMFISLSLNRLEQVKHPHCHDLGGRKGRDKKRSTRTPEQHSIRYGENERSLLIEDQRSGWLDGLFKSGLGYKQEN